MIGNNFGLEFQVAVMIIPAVSIALAAVNSTCVKERCCATCVTTVELNQDFRALCVD